MVLLDDLRIPREPVVGVGRADVGPVILQIASVAFFVLQLNLRRPVQGGVLRVVDVGRDATAAIHEPIVLDAMGGCAKVKALGPDCFFQVTDQITLRPHLDSGPVGETAVVHLETVMVLKDGNDITRAGFFEEMRPGLRIILLGFEHGDEIFVAELSQRAIGA